MLAGAILTAIIQSSSASVGILQALCLTGSVPYATAIPIIMGQNIGTCVTALLSSIGAGKNAKRAALVHLYFNVIGTTVFMIVFYSLYAFIDFSFMHDAAGVAGIAVIHSLFNIGATILLFPFANMLENILTSAEVGAFFKGLLLDGIISGIGSVITFFPQIILLFLFLSFLEDSGYMARTAFIMDKLFIKIGLSGKSFVPMIMGFGCSVPAIMAVRTLDNERDRKLTMLLIPFMSCGAKMPVYAVFTAALFPNNAGIVTFSLYILGIALGIISGLILSNTVFKGDEPPFILELPPYRMPTFKSTFNHMWDKVKDFLTRVGTVILLASIIIWLW